MPRTVDDLPENFLDTDDLPPKGGSAKADTAVMSAGAATQVQPCLTSLTPVSVFSTESTTSAGGNETINCKPAGLQSCSAILSEASSNAGFTTLFSVLPAGSATAWNQNDGVNNGLQGYLAVKLEPPPSQDVGATNIANLLTVAAASGDHVNNSGSSSAWNQGTLLSPLSMGTDQLAQLQPMFVHTVNGNVKPHSSPSTGRSSDYFSNATMLLRKSSPTTLVPKPGGLPGAVSSTVTPNNTSSRPGTLISALELSPNSAGFLSQTLSKRVSSGGGAALASDGQTTVNETIADVINNHIGAVPGLQSSAAQGPSPKTNHARIHAQSSSGALEPFDTLATNAILSVVNQVQESQKGKPRSGPLAPFSNVGAFHQSDSGSSNVRSTENAQLLLSVACGNGTTLGPTTTGVHKREPQDHPAPIPGTASGPVPMEGCSFSPRGGGPRPPFSKTSVPGQLPVSAGVEEQRSLPPKRHVKKELVPSMTEQELFTTISAVVGSNSKNASTMSGGNDKSDSMAAKCLYDFTMDFDEQSDDFDDDSVYFDTSELCNRVAYELKAHSIPQAVFAEKILGRSQGTLSEEASMNRRAEEDKQMMGIKKPRLVFTDIQRRTLHAIFKETRRPSKEMQQTIAEHLGLDLSTVQNFFMNARRRCRDRLEEEDCEDVPEPTQIVHKVSPPPQPPPAKRNRAYAVKRSVPPIAPAPAPLDNTAPLTHYVSPQLKYETPAHHQSNENYANINGGAFGPGDASVQQHHPAMSRDPPGKDFQIVGIGTIRPLHNPGGFLGVGSHDHSYNRGMITNNSEVLNTTNQTLSGPVKSTSRRKGSEANTPMHTTTSGSSRVSHREFTIEQVVNSVASGESGEPSATVFIDTGTYGGVGDESFRSASPVSYFALADRPSPGALLFPHSFQSQPPANCSFGGTAAHSDGEGCSSDDMMMLVEPNEQSDEPHFTAMMSSPEISVKPESSKSCDVTTTQSAVIDEPSSTQYFVVKDMLESLLDCVQ